MRALTAGLVLAVAGLVASCGGEEVPDEVNSTDDAAVAAAFRQIKDDAATLEAGAAFGEIKQDFDETSGLDPVDVNTGEGAAAASIDEQVSIIVTALEDEPASAALPKSDGESVDATLSAIAERVSEVDESLAAELEEARDGLSGDATGGASAPAPAESAEPEQEGDSGALADVSEKLSAAGFEPKPIGTDDPVAGVRPIAALRVLSENGPPTLVYAYASEADAQAVGSSGPFKTIPNVVQGPALYWGRDPEGVAAATGK